MYKGGPTIGEGFVTKRRFESWGRLPKVQQELLPLRWRSDPFPPAAGMLLPHGLGRSYGDSCLNDGGTLLWTRGLSRLISFDRSEGILRCEAGVSLEELIDLCVPQGWFLPVTPGTKYVTVGGAVANDVHGKNHVKDGTFGRFVRAFELLRSDGQRLLCTPTENEALFRATIGGLGLTGLITWVEVQLRPINNPLIRAETIRFGGLDEFYAINDESEGDYLYTVAWIDVLAKGSSLGRGLYIRGNHAPPIPGGLPPLRPSRKLEVPVDAPALLVGPWSTRLFNFAYYRKQLRKRAAATTPLDPFFYPLDAVLHWNRLYGKRGFFQWQCVVPIEGGAILSVLEEVARSKEAAPLAVLKTFGDLPSPGLLSFPRPGVTLALDFPNRGDRTLHLLDRLDRVVRESGGALYPAKDARMSPETFRGSFPNLEAFLPMIDPRFSSSFWRRVMAAPDEASP